MNEKLPILNVHMLGDFSVMYGNQPISFGKNTTTKAMKLLQILLYHGEQGISREKLLNALVCTGRTGRCLEQPSCYSSSSEKDHR